MHKTILLYLLLLTSCSLLAQEKQQNATFRIADIQIEGNKKTKAPIILRELRLNIGDTINKRKIESFCKEAEENIMNLSLFNFVTVTTEEKEQEIIIFIQVKERWYLWPIPFVVLSDRNFNAWWEKKDLHRFSYGLYIAKENCRGRNEKLQILAGIGYNRQIGFAYSIPYINKKKSWGISFVALDRKSHESSYITLENKENFIRIDENYAKMDFSSLVEFNYRKSIHNFHRFRMQYNQIDINDSILLLNSDYLPQKHTKYFSFNYKFKHDYRNYIHYPLKGHYFDIEITKYGLGLMDNNINHARFYLTGRKYFQLASRTYFGSELKTGFTIGNNDSYYFSQALGYNNDFVRSFETYVIDGLHYGLFKSSLKYELQEKKEMHFSFIPWEKFNHLHYAVYFNLFTDAAYVYSKNPLVSNKLDNSLVFGSGIGLDFVTYYDIVFRLEYAWNPIYQGGFFIHFMSAI
jgi:outer membrane protein assembly factor BamA